MTDDQYVFVDTAEEIRERHKANISVLEVLEKNIILKEAVSVLTEALKAAQCALYAPRDSVVFNMAEAAIKKAIEKMEKVK